jgi:mannosyltransferase
VLVATIVVLLAVSVHLRTPGSRKDDASAISAALFGAAESGDGVVYMPLRRRLWVMAHPERVRGLEDVALERSPAASGTLHGEEVPAEQIRDRMLVFPRIVAVTDPEGQPLDMDEREIAKRETLQRYFRKCSTRHAGGARIMTYVRLPATCAHDR